MDDTTQLFSFLIRNIFSNYGCWETTKKITLHISGSTLTKEEKINKNNSQKISALSQFSHEQNFNSSQL